MLNPRQLRGRSKQARLDLIARIESRTELPLLLLAFLTVPVFFGPLLWDTAPAHANVLDVLRELIWAVLAIDLGVKLYISPAPVQYLRRNWLEALSVAIPVLRLARIIRLFLQDSPWSGVARRFSGNEFILAYGFGAVITAATLIMALEHDSNPAISRFPDALWWAVVTVSTVGYGDVAPVTVGGKITAGALMVFGVGLFSAFTANVALRLLANGNTRQSREVDAEVSELMEEMRSLRTELQSLARQSRQ